MHLYSGLSTDFIRDSATEVFRQFRFNPSPSEVNSWRNSLRAVSQVIDDAKLHDHGILLECQLPMTSKRLDCMVTGQDGDRRDSAVIIELKQWDRCGDAGADNLVTTRLGGVERDLLYPSAQVGQYQSYLDGLPVRQRGLTHRLPDGDSSRARIRS